MFGMLRYDAKGASGSELVLESTSKPDFNGSGSGQQHLACEKCRARKVRDRTSLELHVGNETDNSGLLKLRCSGQKTGCDRCRASSSSCHYVEGPDGRGSRRRNRNHNEKR